MLLVEERSSFENYNSRQWTDEHSDQKPMFSVWSTNQLSWSTSVFILVPLLYFHAWKNGFIKLGNTTSVLKYMTRLILFDRKVNK